MVRTFYNNAPEVVGWWLDDYFDFTNSQKAVLEPALHRVHKWHRHHQLPEYIAMLQELKLAASKDKISTSEACRKIERIKMNLSTLQLEFIPAIIEIAPLLKEEQLIYFNQKLSKRADKWKAEWWQESIETQIDARFEKIEDFAETVYGDLNKSQRTLIREKLEERPTQPDIAYAEILRRSQDLSQTITALRETALSDSQKSDLIKKGFARLQYSPNEAYQQYAKQLTQSTCELIADLHAVTDKKQKQHAITWFGKFVTQLSNQDSL